MEQGCVPIVAVFVDGRGGVYIGENLVADSRPLGELVAVLG